jgi:hypothetical protein
MTPGRARQPSLSSLPTHFCQHLSETANLVTISRPVALTLRLHGVLIVLDGLSGERVVLGRRSIGASIDVKRGGALASAASTISREQPVERLVQRLLHHDLILVGHNDALELRDPSASGAEVERTDIVGTSEC